MEYKKVEKCNRREETRQRNILLEERSEKRNKSEIAGSKFQSILECTNAVNTETRREIRINKEDININGNDKISNICYASDGIKDANFEYEEEWDIGGIPELLNDLDADIEKSLKNIQNTKFDGTKNAINNRQDIQPLHSKHCLKQKTLNNLNSHENAYATKFSKNKTPLESKKSVSTFTGFSKGGNLISNATTLNENTSQQIKAPKDFENQSCAFSMSSQAGNNGNTSSNISGAGINITCGQSISGSNSSNKLNNKMSIDHQATLDKGLKMKIKRTKPGTKSLEAKHEIVKATEQQQNGISGSGTSICSTNQEEITCLLSNQSTSSNTQNSNITMGLNNSQGVSNLTGNKKILGSGNNQNISSTSGSISLSTTTSITNSVSQTISQGTKRGSSGHRRDKTKDKYSHSNRTGIDKNALANTEKESTERPLCHCSTADNNASTCSDNSCNRKTENNTLTQRLPAKIACSSIPAVPPGVFTPSTDNPTSAVVSNLLAVTTNVSTPIGTQTISNSVSANSPGPPSKEITTNNGSNVKISSHIAAQLAAAAASSSSANGSSTTSPSFANTEIKSSNVQSQTVKQLSPEIVCNSSAISQTLLPGQLYSQKTSCVSSTKATEKSKITTLKNENSESPPAKRLKHTDNNATATSINKEMVDICIGTSIGTITEPDCLGPCEPGTSVTLEGIVWHETEGGVLVVNVTWRGKTYVGTLLDCTRHDWAPPRFCDSPTEDLDGRTPKGRGKRGRATVTPDLSNFTETRSSIYFSHSQVHSKLRNGSTKGGRGTSRTNVLPIDKANNISSHSSGNSGSTPSTSPTAFLPSRTEKRKSKDESPPPPASADNEAVNNSGPINASGITNSSSDVLGLTNQPQSLINPITGLNVQISTKKCKSALQCAISPVLLECPENDCSKKYKHINGLRYHQSHAHGSTSMLDEDSMAETEEHITPQPSPQSSTPTPSLTPNLSDLIPNNQISTQPESMQVSEESKIKKFNEADISQQLKTSEKHFTSESASSLSLENILSSTVATSTTPTIQCISESLPTGKTQQHEKQEHFINLGENGKMNPVTSLESNNPAKEKSGVLYFGQGEVKNNNGSCLLPTDSPNEIAFQSESLEAGSPIKSLAGSQESNNIFCAEALKKSTHIHQNEHETATNKASPATSVILKPKKERKSPSINDYESVQINSCIGPSREDVQSPAYSDISDDSNPINDSDHIHKVDVSKGSDLIKKSQDIGLSIATTCPSSQTNIPSTLSSYGVYQFYQQQQFIVPPAAEQQQPIKNTLNSNMGSTPFSPSITQQQAVSEFNSKKDPPLDLIAKANSSQAHSNQHCQEINKEPMRTISVTCSQGNSELPSIGSSALNSTTPKSVSHFYAFNYMPSNYSFNVDHNFGSASSITTSEENTKPNRFPGIPSPNGQSQPQHSPVFYKENRQKHEINSLDSAKSGNLQISLKQSIKSDSVAKSECIKQESACNPLSQIPQHLQIQSKDHQGIGVYANMYQRHPLALATQQLSREEELRRYYIFSDQQRRHNSSSHNTMNPQVQNTSQSGNQQCKDDTVSQQHALHNQQQIKIKGNTSLNISKSTNSANTSKESPKQEEDSKVIKQEGQKPTMETQGPPPPPTSQYFLHPSYITSTPFGFDPSHPMYRNVLMPATSPYNTPPYHLSMPRYHTPEDLSRNTGTKALDALHHAASQYYTTHKIHELSERALKSPNNLNSSSVPGSIKISSSSPNIGTTQHSNAGSTIIGHHAVQNQSSSGNQLPHNLATQNIGIANKQDITCQKIHGNSPGAVGTPNETQKPQTSSAVSSCNSGNGNNINNGSTSDSRSPPPQRHVHTHHHTHVGLGYPMYPAPYGAAVLASQQAAAVAVINPFPPGPNK